MGRLITGAGLFDAFGKRTCKNRLDVCRPVYAGVAVNDFVWAYHSFDKTLL